MTSGSRERGFMKRLFVVLFGLAGLGVGVWVFRAKRRGQQSGRAKR